MRLKDALFFVAVALAVQLPFGGANAEEGVVAVPVDSTAGEKQDPAKEGATQATSAGAADKSESSGEVGAQAEPAKPIVHKVKKGDTLWAISSSYLADPFKWPKLWKKNPFIQNPHLIYPGNIIRITADGIEIIDKEGVALAVAAEPSGAADADAAAKAQKELPVVELEPDPSKYVVLEPEPGAEPVAALVVRIPVNLQDDEGFITRRKFKESGIILSSMNKKALMTVGESAFVQLRAKSGFDVGDRYSIFTENKEMRHPVTDRPLGVLVTFKGILELTKTEGVMEGYISRADGEIEAGYKLMPYEDPTAEVVVSMPPDNVNGYVLTSNDGRDEMFEGTLLYIDKGTKDGLAPGNVLGVFSERGTVKNPYKKRKSKTGNKVHLPDEDIGRIIVVRAEEGFSTCLLLESVYEVRTGDYVRSLPKD